ncbi:MAG: LysR family transcriptional regulator [Elusimicrobia bacterium]|nr:LysR family transcriptional regulator [Elusimicrobiota bacterium]
MSMLPFNFNQLYYFWIIAKAGSITAATRQLLLNQSTLSQQLQQLERSVGRRLLLRSRRGVAPNAEGRVVFEYCERIFGQAEELAGRLRGGDAAAARYLRLGFCRSISREKVLAVAGAVKARDPGMIVRMASGTPEGLEDKLRRRLFDLALCDVDLSRALGPDFRARLVASIPHFFVCTPALKSRGRSFPRMLEEVPLMVRAEDNALHKDAMDFLRRNGVFPCIQAQVEDPDLILTMALRGEGVGFLDPFTIQRYLDSGRLVKLHERSLGIRENLWLLCSRHPHSSAPVQSALDALMSGFRLDWRAPRD